MARLVTPDHPTHTPAPPNTSPPITVLRLTHDHSLILSSVCLNVPFYPSTQTPYVMLCCYIYNMSRSIFINVLNSNSWLADCWCCTVEQQALQKHHNGGAMLERTYWLVFTRVPLSTTLEPLARTPAWCGGASYRSSSRVKPHL